MAEQKNPIGDMHKILVFKIFVLENAKHLLERVVKLHAEPSEFDRIPKIGDILPSISAIHNEIMTLITDEKIGAPEKRVRDEVKQLEMHFELVISIMRHIAEESDNTLFDVLDQRMFDLVQSAKVFKQYALSEYIDSVAWWM